LVGEISTKTHSWYQSTECSNVVLQ